MRIAVVHDWLVTYAGAERVLENILKCYPDADIFTIVDFASRKDCKFLDGKKVTTSFIQRLPFAKKHYRGYLPLMPLAIEQHDLSGYDLIISSSHAVAKGVLTGPDQVHVSYVHSPIRYAWDLQHQYLYESGLSKGIRSWIARLILHYIRIWDSRTANGVDAFAANSQFISRRINKTYRRESRVIYPPVNVSAFTIGTKREEFYLTASRMVPYKKIPLIINAFASMPERQLVVIGDGPEFKKAKQLISPNITLLGYQPGDVLRDYMQRAKAFVFAAEEDFGITPVEAQACGTPVIAFGRGGVLETVLDLMHENPTGLFFSEQTVGSLVEAIHLFEQNQSVFTSDACRRNAERFGDERFRNELMAWVEDIASSRGTCNQS